MTNMGQAVDKAQIGEMSFWEHLDVLRASLIKIAIATVLCGIVAFLFKEEVFSVIHMKNPFRPYETGRNTCKNLFKPDGLGRMDMAYQI